MKIKLRLLAHSRVLQQYKKIIDFIGSRKQTESTKTNLNFHKTQNSIKNIVLRIEKDISDKNYGGFQQLTKFLK